MKKTMKKNMRKKIFISLERKKNNIKVYIKIPKEFEDYFKKMSNEDVRTSVNWKYQNGEGAKFYALTDEYQRIEEGFNYDIFNDYGNGLLVGEKVNLAMLRTVGASEGVVITSDKFLAIDNMDFEYYIRKLGEVSKKIWEKCVSDKKLKAVITFEI